MEAHPEQRRQRRQDRIERQRITAQEAADELKALRPIAALGDDERQLPVGHRPKPPERIVQRPAGPEAARTRELVRVSVRHDEHVAGFEAQRGMTR